MVDRLLSRGLIAFVGVPGRVEDIPPDERVRRAVGEGSAPAILARVKAVLDGLHAADPPVWQSTTLAGVARRVEQWLAAHHPEQSDEAIAAVKARISFDFR